jgi:transposase InsO family protein
VAPGHDQGLDRPARLGLACTPSSTAPTRELVGWSPALRCHRRRGDRLRGITHRRGGYRDPESQAFIESWFGQFTKRLAWRSAWESLDQARKEITGYVDASQSRPHSRLAYLTPAEVAATRRPDPDVLQIPAT